MAVRIFEDTTSPSLSDTIRVNGVAFDLTGSTVEFRMRAVGSSTLKVDASATVVSAAAGTVRYDWDAADVDTPGDYLGWWRVTLPSTAIQETAEFAVEVVSHAPTVSALTTVAAVREYLQKPVGDREQDQVIENLIVRASELVMAYTGREFVLADGGSNPRTRVFPVGGYWRTRVIPVGDMASAPTAVVVQDADGATVQTLTVGTDTEDRPHNPASWEPITHLYLRSTAPSLYPTYRLSVTGAFGFPSVPHSVQQAAIITVGTWLRRDVSAFSQTFALDEARVERPESLPQAAIRMLDVWRSPGVA